MSEWRDIASAPKDGSKIFVWAPGFEWPEVVRWKYYSPEDREEVGEEGYWTYAESLLEEATDSTESEYWTHWMPLPAPPSAPKTVEQG